MSFASVSVAKLTFWLLACVLAAGQDCLAGDCSASGRGLLQKRAESEELDAGQQWAEASFAKLPVLVQMTEIINGIPVHFNELENTPKAAALLQGSFFKDDLKRWVVNLPDTWTHQQVHDFNSSLAAAGLHDEWEGEAENAIVVEATADKVQQFLSTLSTTSGSFKGTFIEQDFPVAASPLSSSIVAEEEEEEEDQGSGGVPWGLDRVDDRQGLDNDYSSFPSSAGAGVNVYVLDTGIRFSHQDFGGRAFPAWDFYKPGTNKVCSPTDMTCAYDRQKHGTHCAGTVAGQKSGVAKQAKVFSVKVLSDTGSGSFTGILGGMDWVIAHGNKPAIMSMSLGGKGQSASVDRIVAKAHNAGVPVVVAAGNSNDDACKYLPANAPAAITVGSTQRGDGRSGFSNYGTCLDIYAPGSSILSAGHQSDTSYTTLSGTSMACPHVAGAAALLFGQSPSMSSTQIEAALKNAATSGVVTDAKTGSPNRFLYTGSASPSPPTPTTTTQPPQPTTSRPLPGPDAVACDFEQRLCQWTSVGGAWRTGPRTPSSQTGPQKGDHSPQGSNFAYLESSAPNYPRKTFSLVSPRFSGSTQFSFLFWYNMYGSTMGTLVLEGFDGTGTWSKLWEMKGNKGDTWFPASVSIPVGTTQLRFSGTTTTSYTSDFALDDMSISRTPPPSTQTTSAPPTPTTITTTMNTPSTQAPTTIPPTTLAPTMPPTTATTTGNGDLLIPIVVNASETDHFDINVTITK